MLSSGCRQNLHLLFVLAFVLAGISPACKFLSGEARLVEICTAAGLEVVAMPPDQVPASQNGETHQKGPECQFCFAVAKVKALGTIVTIKPAAAPGKIQPAPAALAAITYSADQNYAPRAPPLFS